VLLFPKTAGAVPAPHLWGPPHPLLKGDKMRIEFCEPMREAMRDKRVYLDRDYDGTLLFHLDGFLIEECPFCGSEITVKVKGD
jgi:hypothetical protein